MNAISVRNSRRHDLNENQWIEIMVKRDQEETDADNRPSCVAATIVDISQTGIKIRSEVPFEFHESLVLEVPRTYSDQTLGLIATVRWTQPDEDTEMWMAGCVIADEFPPEYINEIARDGIVDRRNNGREKISIEANGRFELSSDSFPINISDVSLTGLRLFSPKACEVGSRIQVTFDEEERSERFTARTVFQSEVDGGYLIGCRVLEGSPYSLLGRSVQPEAPKRNLADVGKKSLAVVGIGFMLIWLVRQLFFN